MTSSKWNGAAAFGLLFAASLAVGPTVAAGPPAASAPRPTASPAERLMLAKIRAGAKRLDPSLRKSLAFPRRVDYSDLLTYIRCQSDPGGGYGCPTYAGLSVCDALNEMQHPYTPDLSFRYAERTFDEYIVNAVLHQGVTVLPNMLPIVFRAGISSEGLCRSESDYLTFVHTTPALKPYKPTMMWWNPPPEAAAKEEAAFYRFDVDDTFLPEVDALREKLLTHGPVWAEGPWWWDGGHVMAFTGYDDDQQVFMGVDSSGDWAWVNGFWTIPYHTLADCVHTLQTFKVLATPRATGKAEYSSRIRIRGTWRGTWTVKIGVEGRVPLTVYRSYGRVTGRAMARGSRLDIDVPLPDYAAQCWPPSAKNRWFLEVEDNDRDGGTGRVIEWILARNHRDPRCRSVGEWKTETHVHTTPVEVPDATGDPGPVGNPETGAAPSLVRNAQPGRLTLRIPEDDAFTGPAALAALATTIVLDAGASTLAPSGSSVIRGTLSTPAMAPARIRFGGSQGAGRTVELCQRVQGVCLARPPTWETIATGKTGPGGTFEFSFISKPGAVYGVAHRRGDGEVACSTQPLAARPDLGRWVDAPALDPHPLDLPEPGIPRRGGPGLRQPRVQ